MGFGRSLENIRLSPGGGGGGGGGRPSTDQRSSMVEIREQERERRIQAYGPDLGKALQEAVEATELLGRLPGSEFRRSEALQIVTRFLERATYSAYVSGLEGMTRSNGAIHEFTQSLYGPQDLRPQSNRAIQGGE